MSTLANSTLPRISATQPSMDGNERAYVLECVDTTWISSAGRFILEFEQEFSRHFRVRNAITCTNGEMALHLALVALEIGTGDEVILPSLAEVHMAHAVSYAGATPVFIDCAPNSLTLDPAKLQTLITSRTKAILAPHLYGSPCDVAAIVEIAQRHGVKVIEEASDIEAGQRNVIDSSLQGDCAIFNFSGNRLINTGEGGMITTNDDDLASRIRLLRGQGMDLTRRYWFPVVGYNYRMTNIQAAIGLAQLERISERAEARNRVATWYDDKFVQLGERLTRLPPKSAARYPSGAYTVRLTDHDANSRDLVIAKLEAGGIESARVAPPIHLMPPYAHLKTGALPWTDAVAADGLNLPVHADLTAADVDRVVATLAEVLAQN